MHAMIDWFTQNADWIVALLVFWAITDGIDKMETKYGNIKRWPSRVVTAYRRRKG